MIGRHHIEVKNRDAVFKFDICRNITIVRGNSGTGKSTLYEMIADYTRLNEKSGVNLSCDKDCVALTDNDWKNQLSKTSDSIVFIDEGADCLKSTDFAGLIKKTDNYYVIFNRESLHELPYSVEEIYEIKTSGKQHTLKKIYKTNAEHVYYISSAPKKLEYNTVVTEDSKSGYQFYKNYFADTDIKCYTSGSNSALFGWLKDNIDKKALVIADGAAFGAEIDRILKLGSASKFRLCLPESFEWLILKSGLIKAKDIKKVLETPENYVDSKKYFSWENFFEKYLVENTVGTPYQYAKSKLNPNYLKGNNSDKIIKEVYKK